MRYIMLLGLLVILDSCSYISPLFVKEAEDLGEEAVEEVVQYEIKQDTK